MADVVKNKIWMLKRCARSEVNIFHSPTGCPQPVEQEHGYSSRNDNSQWTYFSSDKKTLELCLTESLHFIIRQENLIIENISLLGAKDTLRLIAKGDSVLAIYKSQFDEQDQQSGLEQCQHFIKEMCNYTDIKLDNHTLTANSIGFAEIIKSISDPSNRTIPGVSTMQTIDSLQLEEAIVHCLLDDTFPSFVAAVEKCLHQLTVI